MLAYHCFVLTIDPAIDVFARRQEMVNLIERRAGVDLPDNPARVDFRISDLGKYRIVITLFCPTRLADALENDITCDVMSWFHGVSQAKTP